MSEGSKTTGNTLSSSDPIDPLASRYVAEVADSGALGLPFTYVGEVVQSLAMVLVDRGYDKDRVVHQLRDGIEHNWFNEAEFWSEFLGPAADRLAEWLDLPENADVP